MPEKVAQEDVAMRKKRLVLYGLVVVVAVAFTVSLVVMWMVLMPLGNYLGKVVLYSALITLGTAVLCAIVWFGYRKLILKE